MRSFMAINKRNMGLYFRDHAAVFFSLLSMLITVALMVFFLGDAHSSSILDMIGLVPGRGGDSDAQAAKDIVFLWTCAGILTINASTVTHAFYSTMIKDRTGNRLNSLMVMPVHRTVFVMGYVFSAWLTGVLMGIVTFAVTEAIGVAKGMEMLSFATHVKILLLIMLNSFVFASIMFFLASLFRSSSAWSGVGIVLGTLAGFLGGIYFPIGQMGVTIVKVVKCLPFIYGTSLFRKAMLLTTEDAFFEGTPSLMREEFDSVMGTNLFIDKNQLSEISKVGILMGVGVLFVVLSTVYITLSKKKDR